IKTVNLAGLTLSQSITNLTSLQKELTNQGDYTMAAPTTKNMSLQQKAAVLLRRQFRAHIRDRKIAALSQVLSFMQHGETESLLEAAHELKTAVRLQISPVMLRDTKTVLLKGRGKAIVDRKHWLVEEFYKSLRLPLPRRHKSLTEEYYQRLKQGFREHEHTR
ncbi:unnamed protein product, partial [marine sediment metagenome]